MNKFTITGRLVFPHLRTPQAFRGNPRVAARYGAGLVLNEAEFVRVAEACQAAGQEAFAGAGPDAYVRLPFRRGHPTLEGQTYVKATSADAPYCRDETGMPAPADMFEAGQIVEIAVSPDPYCVPGVVGRGVALRLHGVRFVGGFVLSET